MPSRSPQPGTARSAARDRCEAKLAELSEYLDGELSPARCAAIERHLSDCACCGRLAARLRRAIAACREADVARLPRGVRSRARARIAALLDASEAGGQGVRRPRGTRARH
jgi:anti-sigma factor RsiW